jgi:hypothetical protein
MNLFISWSGELSHKIALILREWIPTVLPAIKPWVSSEDIAKGERWSDALAKQLEATSIGIICVDPSNARSPWLNFEAGALSKIIDKGGIFPLLVGINPSELDGPLSQFQVTTLGKEEMFRLIESLHSKLGGTETNNDSLYRTYTRISWLALSAALETAGIDCSRSTTNTEQTSQPSSVEEHPKGRMTDPEISILKFLANVGGASMGAINSVLEIHMVKIEYYLDRLLGNGYVIHDVFSSSWSITKKGIGYLDENDLI